MSALNDSRTAVSKIENRTWAGTSAPCEEAQRNADSGLGTSYETNHPQLSDAYYTGGFSLEHQVHTLQQIAERHERQIAALTVDKHAHCDNLTNVYEQLGQVLEKLRLPSFAEMDSNATTTSEHPTSSQLSASPFLLNSTSIGYAAAIINNSSVSLSTQRKKTEGKLNELLCQHRDQVYDVLADYHSQMDKNAQETKRRLDAVEKSVAHLRSEIRELKQLVSSSAETQQGVESRLRDEIRNLSKQQETQRMAVDKTTSEHAEKVQHCCDGLSVCLQQLSEETKAIKRQQQRREKELDLQIRSIVATEQHVAEVLERQSHSIAELETQDSLGGAFHEVKDWLADLEKRMVSRGELLKWTESLQQEMSTLRRASAPVAADTVDVSADTATPIVGNVAAGYGFTSH